MLWHSLIYLQSHMNDFRTNLKLVHIDSAFYYKHAQFHVFRYKRQLIIRLDVPLTLRNLANPLTIWKLNKIPLASQNQSHYMMLNANIKSILYTSELNYYLVLNHLLDSDMQTLETTKEGIILQDRNVKTCPLTLLENDLSEIQTYCGYSVVDSPVPKAVYRITADLILLSNITQLTIKCENNDTLQIINLKEIQTVHELHCSCSYHADSFYIAHSPLHCDETIDSNFTIEPKYIINLPYAHAFLGKSILDMIKEDDIFNMSIPIKLPRLAIAEKVYQDRISLDQEKSFDLATVINQTQMIRKFLLDWNICFWIIY